MKLLESGKGYTIDEMVRLSSTSIAFVMKCKKIMKNQYKEVKPKKEKRVLKQIEMPLLDVIKKEEKEVGSEDKWKLEALEAQLAWIKNSVIPIPSKKSI